MKSAVRNVMVGKEAEDRRNRARRLNEMAIKSVT